MGLVRWRQAWMERSYTLALALILPVSGILAIIYGDGVSAALSTIAADTVSRSMGVAFLVGASSTAVGLLLRRHVLEVVGLAIMAAGLFTYGLGVLLGLGLHGAVAGSIALAAALGTVLRVISLGAASRDVDE